MRMRALVFAWFLVAGCSDSDSNDDGTGDGDAAACPEASTLTYDNFGQAFMTNYCTRCHAEALTGTGRNGAPTAVNLDTLQGVKDSADEVNAHAGVVDDEVRRSMPPNGSKPTDAQRQQLAEWIACGLK